LQNLAPRGAEALGRVGRERVFSICNIRADGAVHPSLARTMMNPDASRQFYLRAWQFRRLVGEATTR